ncbi:hypothetical protein EBME_0691 [bacterium endosymbiont of Mortierella elongata FMR23-6]|nr:hypothetical protein EBME_0691 [bacterium endosymbiont of Mortierella elongata FMR23-6]
MFKMLLLLLHSQGKRVVQRSFYVAKDAVYELDKLKPAQC